MSNPKIRLIAPKTKDEAVAILPRLGRFKTSSGRWEGNKWRVAREGTQFDDESKASLEEMLRVEGWIYRPKYDGIGDAWVWIDSETEWKKSDRKYPVGPWSFVRAIQFTVRVMAGRDARYSDIVREHRT